MNLGIASLPADCDVLVVGAGPAGSAAAILLARAGVDVVLVDQHAFPRDKICGDGLIPDAHHALARLGAFDAVMSEAQPAAHVACTGPRGGRVEVPGALAVLPRKRLDEIVCGLAVQAGARMHAPVKFVAPLEADGVVVGARLQHDGAVREVRARWLLLATGAVPQALLAAGMAERQTPSGVALRGYVKNDAMVGRINALEIVWHRALAPGYGWIFPCGGGVFNIGVGVADSHDTARGDEASTQRFVKREVNLKRVMDDLQRVFEPARRLIAGGTPLGPMKGAPLRCTLRGARYTRPGLLVVGEAAGSTYSFSGEGIGKAYETGMHAAEVLLAGGIATPRTDAPDRAGVCPNTMAIDATDATLQSAAAAGAAMVSEASLRNAAPPAATLPAATVRDAALLDTAVRADYEARLAALQPRFDLYQRANIVNRHPWLADLLIWRANRSPRIVRRMSGVLEETSNPGNLISLKGLSRLFLDRR